MEMPSGQSDKHQTDHGQKGSEYGINAASPLKDPVCGMTVTTASQYYLEHDSHPFYFCSAKCKSRFEASPEKYTHPEAPAAPSPPEAAKPGTIYTCPMHPQIRQDHPGNCPICGMALEPEMPTLGDDENPELDDFTRRFWWTLPSL